jgi:uncharacterized protein (DUF433 family)
VVRGTRLAVAFLLELFGKGWTRQEILECYPELMAEALQACFAYASEVIAEYRSVTL